MTAKMHPFWWFKAAYVPTERITNGGFETGDLTGWTSEYASASSGPPNPHSGSYSCELYDSGDPYSAWIRQTFTGVPAEQIDSFDLWVSGVNWGQQIRVWIEYSDATSTIVDIGTLENREWVYADLLPYVEAGKTVTGIKISHNGVMSPWANVDDVSLIS